MEAKNIIYTKLEAFIRKYYTNELLRGSIFVVGLGLLYFIFTLLIEYFLWLPTGGRTALFWLFIAVEAFLLLRFILFPLSKLFKLQKGIDYRQASDIIGRHFSEVSDKLTNFLQLSSQSHQSELLLASIEQKAANLRPVPFTNAINFKKNVKYIPYAAIPLLIILFFLISGSPVLTQGLDRVVHYDRHYAPPAPFEFVVANKHLTAQQDTDFLLVVETKGRVVPENAMITIGDENYYLENIRPGVFQYKFEKPAKDVTFELTANDVTSQPYELNVVAVPTIANFEMVLNFPAYLGKKPEVVRGTGNAVVPEGTKVTWKVEALATNVIEWSSMGKVSAFANEGNSFSMSKTILQNTDYQVLTSNNNIKHHEKLQYQLSTIKDQYPTISVIEAPDSLKLERNILLGQLSDDYGLMKLQVVYYPQDKPDAAKRAALPVKKELVDRFYYAFPDGLSLKEGVNYEYYFEVFDNDAVHNYKSTKSSVFGHRELTEQEVQDKALQEQNSNINSLEKSIKEQDKQMSELDKLQKTGKEKSDIDFKDQKKIQEFINRQQQQDEMMKEFSKQLEKNLNEFNPEKKDQFKEELMKRLEKSEKEAEANKKLLDELKELTKKLEEEELFDKIDELKKQSKDRKKNLEQLVELTKRFYVEQKAEQIAEKLQELGEKQENLAESKENSEKAQQEMNKEFDKLQQEMRELEKQNEELKAPMELPTDPAEEKSIEQDQEKATEELKEPNTKSKEKAKKNQKSAGQKMKEMGANMSNQMAEGDMEQLDEDIKMLRQILDNLLAYSFEQENVMGKFRGTTHHSASFSRNLKIQQDLKQQFSHVDDSLFALSLRQPMITEAITAEVGNVHYSIDKALTDLADNQVPRGVANQQYAITASNKLADMLSDMLNSMQMQMQGSGVGKEGKGSGQGMQLPDIIQKQEGLAEKMKQGKKKGGKEGQEGEKGNPNGKGQGGEGEGDSDSEGEAGKLLEIYKEQQQLRDALQKALEKEGMGGNGQNAVRQMKEIEKQLLNKGFDSDAMQRMTNLKHELLKLDKAVKQQGEENKRQSQTNKKDFNSSGTPIPEALKEYLNSVEILNRQSLPLRPNFNQKVQTYFRTND